MGFDEKVLAKLIKEAGKSRIVWQKEAGMEMVTNGHWAVVTSTFDVRVRVALFAAFAGREIKNGQCWAMTNEEFFERQNPIFPLYRPDDATDIGIITPFIIGPNPDARGDVKICNFGETRADLYGVDISYMDMTQGRSCYRDPDGDEKSPLYFGDDKEVMIIPVKGEWDKIIAKYAGLYRDKSDYIQAMSAAEERVANTELDELKYQEAKLAVITNQQASVSFLQRRVRLGYAQSARAIDRMEQEGIVGPYNGNQPREVLVKE